MNLNNLLIPYQIKFRLIDMFQNSIISNIAKIKIRKKTQRTRSVNRTNRWHRVRKTWWGESHATRLPNERVEQMACTFPEIWRDTKWQTGKQNALCRQNYSGSLRREIHDRCGQWQPVILFIVIWEWVFHYRSDIRV